MKSVKRSLEIFQSIIQNIENNFNELCGYWNIYEKQRFFVSAISIYDDYFLKTLESQLSKDDKSYYYQIIKYGYPIFITRFYDKSFSSLPGVVLKPMDDELLELYSKLIYSCGIVGWLKQFIDNTKSGYVKTFAVGNYIRIKFSDKYHWNEYLENEYLTWYSHTVSHLQREKIENLESIRGKILEKLQHGAFIWQDAFLGYSNDIETETYFQDLALIDAQQSVKWDFFPPDCKFDNVYYGDLVHALVDFSGYAIKHMYAARLLFKEHPNLIFQNLLSCIFVEDDIVRLISSNREVSIEQARKILNIISLNPTEISYYHNNTPEFAPIIKISKSQYVRSICGLLDEPFGFALYALKCRYNTDWDRNVNCREEYFRTQLYSLFSNGKYLCINHPVIIKIDGKVKTDIDAVIVDQTNGDIAFFQLKWQDPSNYSPYALKSKRANYEVQTEKWINAVSDWIHSATEKQMSDLLGVPQKYISKNKIKLFILGREHGNYSSNTVRSDNCAWCQWYQLLCTVTTLSNKENLAIQSLFDSIQNQSPYKKRIIERSTKFIYGKYKIMYGGFSPIDLFIK